MGYLVKQREHAAYEYQKLLHRAPPFASSTSTSV